MDLQTVIKLQGDDLITGSVQDCTPYAEEAQRKHNEGEHGSNELRHAASLPLVLVEKYCNDNGIEFSEWMQNPVHAKRMLADPALSYFRIWPGTV